MKKTVVVVFAFAFLLGTMGVSAQGKKESKFEKPSKAKNVQIHKKQVATEDQRKSFDRIEKELKGKPVKPSPIIDLSAGGATGTIGAPLPDGGQKYALLIGLANYPGTINDLCVAEAETGENYPTEEDGLAYYCKDQDALNMKQALMDNYGYSEANISVFSDAKATYDNIKAKVDELVGTEAIPGKLTEKDEMIFFFSGHGTTGNYIDDDGNPVADENPDEGIVIYDQSYSESEFLNGVSYVPSEAAYIWDDQLKRWFENAKTQRIFFAFDTCMAGGMNDLEADGRVVAMSSKETQSSWTYYLGGTQTDVNVYQESEGLFAHYFVKRGMIDGLADGSNPLKKTNPLKKDGKVAVEEAFNYAYSIVKVKQIPVLVDKFLNDLLLGYSISIK